MARTKEDCINAVLDAVDAALDSKRPVTEEQRAAGRAAARESLLRHPIQWERMAASDLTLEEIREGCLSMWRETLS